MKSVGKEERRARFDLVNSSLDGERGAVVNRCPFVVPPFGHQVSERIVGVGELFVELDRQRVALGGRPVLAQLFQHASGVVVRLVVLAVGRPQRVLEALQGIG